MEGLKSKKIIIHKSAGGILYRKIKNPEFLVAKQIRQTGEIQWVSPKGHIEKGESASVAAIREVREEIGIKSPEIIKFIGEEVYRYFDRGEEHEKSVMWYLMKVELNDKLHLNKIEGFQEARWLPEKSAKLLFSHKGFHKMFELAIQAM